MSEYLKFNVYPREEGKKTVIIRVLNLDGVTLGYIKWRPTWRKYTFLPEPDTVFDSKCLASITRYINNLMNERKKLKQL